jgi:hypothetical protein
MGIYLEWDDPDRTAIRQIFDAQWTWSDFYDAQRSVDEMIDTVDYAVGVILDMPSNVVLPPNALSHGKHYVDTLHPRLYLTALSSKSQLLQTIYDLFGRVYPHAAKRIVLVQDLEEARILLMSKRPQFNLT